MRAKAILWTGTVTIALTYGATAVPPGLLLRPAAAQQHPVLKPVIPESASMTIQAKITAVNPSTREVTLQGRCGNTVTVTAGPIVRLDMLKVGDTVNAQYYRSV